MELEGVNDYEISSPENVQQSNANDLTGTITVQKKALHKVTGKFIDLDKNEVAVNGTLKFTNVDDQYEYTAEINADKKGYSINLREGEYLASTTDAECSTKTHAVVKSADVSRDLLFAVNAAQIELEWKSDIYVGYNNDNAKTPNYKTVSEALKACSRMNPAGEGQRITVHIAPGTYREQIIVNTPYISFVNDTKQEVKLTWYYGIGYAYYSIDKEGYYNPENAYDKYDKHNAEKWGVAVYIQDKATAFRAEGITFENSFNYYTTDEEFADGVTLHTEGTDSKCTFVREKASDVKSKAATERAAAIAVEADQTEFKDCGFYSSQDTLFIGGKKEPHVYFKDCTAEGQTDYIFGNGNVIFDDCTLQWKGYSKEYDKDSKEKDGYSGYITAIKPNSANEQGYLFRNCTVTGNQDAGMKVKAGYFGRPWGANAPVVFLNTKLADEGLIDVAGWTEMRDNKPENAKLYEYNTTLNGSPVDTSGRVQGTVMSEADAKAVKAVDYLGSWKPAYYTADDLEGGQEPDDGLKAPTGLKVTNKSTDNAVSVAFSWTASDGADKYSVTVKEKNAETFVYENADISKDTTSVTISENLERGKIYVFSVTAVKTGADGSEESAALTYRIPTGEVSEREYTFNPVDAFKELGTVTKVPADTLLGTDVYFKAGLYHKDGSIENSGSFVRVRQKAQAGIEFTIEGTATVTVQAASTGGSNDSWILLLNKDKLSEATVANAIPEKGGAISVHGDKAATLTYENVPAGTYTVLTPDKDKAGDSSVTANRDVRIHSITVTETSARPERLDLSMAAKPEVRSVKEEDNILTIEVVNALAGYDGGDRVVVVLEDSDGREVSGMKGISAKDGAEHTFMLDAGDCAGGTYTVRAKLVRGMGDTLEELPGEVTKTFEHSQSLLDPSNLNAVNKGKAADSESGSVLLTWDAAVGAEYYVVEVLQGGQVLFEEKTKENGTSIIIGHDLAIGQKYTFKLYAARQSDGQEERSNAVLVEDYGIIEGEGDAPYPDGKYILQVSKDVDVFAKSEKKDGQMQRTGTDNFFTVLYKSSSEAGDHAETFSDGTKETRRLRFNSAAGINGGAVRFTVTGASKVTVYWQSGGDGREMQILDHMGREVTATEYGTKKGENYITRFYLNNAGTYYLGGKGGSSDLYRIETDNGYVRDRAAWSEVAAPEFLKVETDEQTHEIKLQVKAKIGPEGADGEADKLEITMYDKEGNAAGSAKTAIAGIDPVLRILPDASGEYTFAAALSRDDETEQKTAVYPAAEGETFQYILPLETPKLEDAKNMGAVDDAQKYGSVEITWGSVKEADRYGISVKEKGAADTEAKELTPVTVSAVLIDEGLEVGKTYVFSVWAERDATGKADENGRLVPEKTQKADVEVAIEAEYKTDWNFVVYGIGTATDRSGFVTSGGRKAADEGKFSSGYARMHWNGTTVEENITPTVDHTNEGNVENVRVWTWDGKGKIVPNDTDGLAFYYTKINPQTTNFTLSADLHVNWWQIGNGQEGFGLLAADRIGQNGDTNYHWTNSYTAVVSKIDYYWDNVNGKVSDTNGTKVTLKLGVGSTAKTGVTAQNLPIFKDDVTMATTQYYKTETLPLDTSLHTDIYDNIIANENLTAVGKTDATKSVPDDQLIEDMRLAIELNATGYYIKYTPLKKKADGTFEELTDRAAVIKNYDRNALSMIEENTAYVGFFATRYADITFSNIHLDTRRYDPAEKPEERPIQEMELKASVSGAKTANSKDYTLIYSANWKGVVTIRDEAGAVLAQETIEPKDGDLEEEGSISVPAELHVGTNKFQVTFDPDRNYDPYHGNPRIRLTNYDAKADTVTVTWKQYGKEGDILYVSPNGKASGDGTKLNPLDIYTAVKYVQAGQTIYLMGGTYSLTKSIKIDRGINGTKDKRIYMLADPETCTKENGVRPVLDFNSVSAGIVMAGDWWYYQGFDITRSANQTKGVQVSGSHNVLDGLDIYKNGSTGLQISRLLASDKKEDYWPCDNLILNCTAALNADAGYTDADGFAAKLTVGDNNVFDGCVSAYNADDGWDLFAKVWTGPIGDVVLRNCISFQNGKVLRNKYTQELAWFDEVDNPDDLETVDAGSGNGFKLGGSSMSGHHTVINCVTFRNKSKGIDSNSGRNIEAKNSITFNNESYNLAMYSNAATTDFAATGVISYRNAGFGYDKEDRIGLKSSSTASSIIDTQEDCVEKIFNNTNFFWNKLTNVSERGNDFYKHYTTFIEKTDGTPAVTSPNVSDDWFVALDYDAWVKTYCTTIHSASRDANGRINLHGFLELTQKGQDAMAAAGAKGGVGLGEGQVSKDANDFIAEGVIGTETDGTINTGGADSETGDHISGDDFSQMPGNADEVGLWIAVVNRDQIEYTGKAVKPEINVYNGTTLLKKGKDYTVAYKNNKNAYVGAYNEKYYETHAAVYSKYSSVTAEELKNAYKDIPDSQKPVIIVKGKGNYKNLAGAAGITQAYFDINPVSLTNDRMNRIGTSDITLLSNNKEVKITPPTVTFNNSKLSGAKNRDFAYTVYKIVTDESGNTTKQEMPETLGAAAAGTPDSYFVDIKGCNNFAGVATVNLTVLDRSSSQSLLADNFKLKNKKIPDQYRNGYNKISADEEMPLPVVLSTAGSDAALSVQDKDGHDLEEGRHYRVSYKNNINIGTATVVVTGLSYTDEDGSQKAYYGSKEFKFKILAPAFNKMIAENTAKLIDMTGVQYEKDSSGMYKIADDKLADYGFYTYQYEGRAVDPANDNALAADDGKTHKLGLAVKRGDSWYLLRQGTDYKLTYANNTRAGNASAVFKGIGNYSGSVTQKFQIKAFDLEDENNRLPSADADGNPAASKIGGTFLLRKTLKTNEDGTQGYEVASPIFKGGYQDGIYTGMEVFYEKGGVKPTVSLSINGNQLKAGRDYTVTYKNNSQITENGTPANKMPAIVIKGKNGLTGTLTGTFIIAKKPLNDSENKITVVAQDVKLSKDTGNYKTRIAVKDAKGKALSAGADYSKEIRYELVDNASHKTLKRDNGEDWVLEEREQVSINNEDGYCTIKATIKVGETSKYYTYNPASDEDNGIFTYYRVAAADNSLKKAKFEVNYYKANQDETCLYTADKDGKYFYYYKDGITLNGDLLTVYYADDKEHPLVWGEDFEVVKYIGNDRKGTAKLIIQGKGRYFEQMTVTFKIEPQIFGWWTK